MKICHQIDYKIGSTYPKEDEKCQLHVDSNISLQWKNWIHNVITIMRKHPTIASWRMNGVWIDNNFLLGSNFLIDSIVFITKVIDRGGLGVKWLIKSLLILFVCWKKKY
jgi:hypothetical protein